MNDDKNIFCIDPRNGFFVFNVWAWYSYFELKAHAQLALKLIKSMLSMRLTSLSACWAFAQNIKHMLNIKRMLNLLCYCKRYRSPFWPLCVVANCTANCTQHRTCQQYTAGEQNGGAFKHNHPRSIYCTDQGLAKETTKHFCIQFHNYSNKTIVEVDSELIDISSFLTNSIFYVDSGYKV